MDDQVDLFQRLSTLSLQIRREGSTLEKELKVAAISLGLGQPDQALEHATLVIAGASGNLPLLREAAWVCALAMCLKVAIIEGDAEGAPGWNPPRRRHIAAGDYRLKAMEFLNEMENLVELEAELLEALKAHRDLKSVCRLISLLQT